jgi:uncharacterized protein (TIGR03382 family)
MTGFDTGLGVALGLALFGTGVVVRRRIARREMADSTTPTSDSEH